MDIDKFIGQTIYILHIGILFFLILMIYITNNKKILFIILFIFIIVFISWIIFNTCIIIPLENFFNKNENEEYNFIYILSFFNIKENIQKNIIMINQLFLIFICMIKIYNIHKINEII